MISVYSLLGNAILKNAHNIRKCPALNFTSDSILRDWIWSLAKIELREVMKQKKNEKIMPLCWTNLVFLFICDRISGSIDIFS